MTKQDHTILHNNSTHDYGMTSNSLKSYYQKIAGTDTEAARNEACRRGSIEAHKRKGTYKDLAGLQAAKISEIERVYGVVWDNLTPADKNRYSGMYARESDPTICQRISATLSKRHAEGRFENSRKALADRVWYTNGVDNVYIKAGETPPEGYHRGRTISEAAKQAQAAARQQMSPEARQRLRDAHSVDTSNRIWVTDGEVDRYINKNSDIPEGFRPGRSKVGRNHKIVSIEWIRRPCRVYDLEIVDNHNFALAAGVFVHNSKDVSDSFGGAIYNAIMINPGVSVPVKSVASAIANVNKPRNFGGVNDVNSLFPGMNNPYRKR